MASKWEDLSYPIDMQWRGYDQHYTKGPIVRFTAPMTGLVVEEVNGTHYKKGYSAGIGGWNQMLDKWKPVNQYLEYSPDQQGDREDDI